MVTTNDRELWSKMWSYKDHGKSWEAVYEQQHPPGPRLLHTSFGTNWRMLEMQAAIGLVQLRRMPEWTERRRRHASAIAAVCRRHSAIRVPELSSEMRHAWYRFYAFVNPLHLSQSWTRDRIIEAIVSAGVPCFHGSASEVYLEKAFDGTGWRPHERLPIARELGETSLAFLVHPTLTDAEIDKTCRVLDDVLSEAEGNTNRTATTFRDEESRRSMA